MTKLLRLYPLPSAPVDLAGLYLGLNLPNRGTSEDPFVYANFLSSLDGRIALDDVGPGTSYIPKQLSSASDFALFMELHAQADCLITHGAYLRALGQGRLGNILQVRHPKLQEWRLAHGLKAQPDIVIASASLAFPNHPSLTMQQQTVTIATGAAADPARILYWQGLGYTVLIAGQANKVQAAALVDALRGKAYKTLYLIAGPQMLDTMIREQQLSTLFLTLSQQLIGGKNFHSLLTGDALGTAGQVQLESLYFEQLPDSPGQFFLQYGLARR